MHHHHSLQGKSMREDLLRLSATRRLEAVNDKVGSNVSHLMSFDVQEA
jgi:hypothetical protein